MREDTFHSLIAFLDPKMIKPDPRLDGYTDLWRDKTLRTHWRSQCVKRGWKLEQYTTNGLVMHSNDWTPKAYVTWDCDTRGIVDASIHLLAHQYHVVNDPNLLWTFASKRNLQGLVPNCTVASSCQRVCSGYLKSHTENDDRVSAAVIRRIWYPFRWEVSIIW